MIDKISQENLILSNISQGLLEGKDDRELAQTISGASHGSVLKAIQITRDGIDENLFEDVKEAERVFTLLQCVEHIKLAYEPEWQLPDDLRKSNWDKEYLEALGEMTGMKYHMDGGGGQKHEFEHNLLSIIKGGYTKSGLWDHKYSNGKRIGGKNSDGFDEIGDYHDKREILDSLFNYFKEKPEGIEGLLKYLENDFSEVIKKVRPDDMMQ